jgi:hypothetical protein
MTNRQKQKQYDITGTNDVLSFICGVMSIAKVPPEIGTMAQAHVRGALEMAGKIADKTEVEEEEEEEEEE